MKSLLWQQYIICIHVIVAIYSIMEPYPYDAILGICSALTGQTLHHGKLRSPSQWELIPFSVK